MRMQVTCIAGVLLLVVFGSNVFFGRGLVKVRNKGGIKTLRKHTWSRPGFAQLFAFVFELSVVLVVRYS